MPMRGHGTPRGAVLVGFMGAGKRSGGSVSGRRKPAAAQGVCTGDLSRRFSRRGAYASGRRHVPPAPFRGGPGEGGGGAHGETPAGLFGGGFPGGHGEPDAGPGGRKGTPSPCTGDKGRPVGRESREGKEREMNDGILTVSLGDRSYDIFFASGVYPLFQEWVTRFFQG